MKKKSSLCFATLGGFLMACAMARAGGATVGNGGDDVKLDIAVKRQKLASIVAAYCTKPPVQSASWEQFSKAQDYTLGHDALSGKAQVKVVVLNTPLVIDGEEKVAANYPNELKIEFNRGKWKEIEELEMKYAILLHEYLGVRGSKLDLDYDLSSAFIALFGEERAQKARIAYVCEAQCLVSAGLGYDVLLERGRGATMEEAFNSLELACTSRKGEHAESQLVKNIVRRGSAVSYELRPLPVDVCRKDD
jgi:hypothetical protein